MIAVASCGSGRDAPVENHRTTPIEVRRGADVVERVTSRATTDLWHWCDEDVATIRARGPSGFVQGSCAQRGDQRFVLATAADGSSTATLSRIADSTVVATRSGIVSVELDDGIAAAPAASSLSLVVAGREPIELDAPMLEALRQAHQRKEGIALTALLEHAAVASPRKVVIVGASRFEVDAGLLADRTHEFHVRRNQRGQLRFSHRVGNVERDRINVVTHIEITP